MAIPTGHIPISAIDGWIIKTGLGDACLKIVRDQLRRYAAEERKGTHMAGHPVRQALRPRGFDVGVIGRAQCRDKDLRCAHLARLGADNIHRVARIVDCQSQSKMGPCRGVKMGHFG